MALPGLTRHAPTLDVADVQGLVVRGYGRLPHAAFLACRIRDAQDTRAVLRDLIGEVGSGVGHDADTALQVAFTASGLVALGLRDAIVERGFAAPFVEGMTTEHRQRLLGDVGAADPRHWAWGGPDTPPVHVLLLVYAATAGLLDERRGALLAAAAWGAGARRRPAHGPAGRPRGVRVRRRPDPAAPGRPARRTGRPDAAHRRVRARLSQRVRPARPPPSARPHRRPAADPPARPRRQREGGPGLQRQLPGAAPAAPGRRNVHGVPARAHPEGGRR